MTKTSYINVVQSGSCGIVGTVDAYATHIHMACRGSQPSLPIHMLGGIFQDIIFYCQDKYYSYADTNYINCLFTSTNAD